MEDVQNLYLNKSYYYTSLVHGMTWLLLETILNYTCIISLDNILKLLVKMGFTETVKSWSMMKNNNVVSLHFFLLQCWKFISFI